MTAVTTQPGLAIIGVLAIGAGALAFEEPDVERPERQGCPLPEVRPLSLEERALNLASDRYGDDRHRFEVFSTVTHGTRDVVVVRRSTGDCGGCGAFTVAVVFESNSVEMVEKLGEYGRFGNGPDEVRVRDVVGRTVIEVDESISMHGYSNTYREYFTLDGVHLQKALCLNIDGSDHGARERGSEWTSRVWIANEGTLYFVPEYTMRGEVTPILYAFSFPFEHGRWVGHEDKGECIDPRGDDLE